MGSLADCWRVDPDELMIRLFEQVENKKDGLPTCEQVHVASVGKGQVLFAQVNREKTQCCLFFIFLTPNVSNENEIIDLSLFILSDIKYVFLSYFFSLGQILDIQSASF